MRVVLLLLFFVAFVYGKALNEYLPPPTPTKPNGFGGFPEVEQTSYPGIPCPWKFHPNVSSTTAVDIIKGYEAVGEVISKIPVFQYKILILTV
ncbi:hypothetical protein HUJ05_007837 [Dendroctonus ponderosae]|nr:hypothetical protein HUJ05_007837 [Dendroctonus ponderosae]